jgi:hypothetical protein
MSIFECWCYRWTLKVTIEIFPTARSSESTPQWSRRNLRRWGPKKKRPAQSPQSRQQLGRLRGSLISKPTLRSTPDGGPQTLLTIGAILESGPGSEAFSTMPDSEPWPPRGQGLRVRQGLAILAWTRELLFL